MKVSPSDAALLAEAAAASLTHGLLTRDAFIVTHMLRHGIDQMATNDDDFDPVPGITVCKPRP